MTENNEEQTRIVPTIEPFSAMEPEKPDESTEILKYAVDPSAEKVISVLAKMLQIIGIAGGLICFIVSIVMFSNFADEAGWILLGVGIIVILVGLVEWAFLKVFVNISRSLYNINDALRKTNK